MAAPQVNWEFGDRVRRAMIIRDPVELQRENAQVLNLVQAMISGVTPNLRGVSLECWERGVRLHFLMPVTRRPSGRRWRTSWPSSRRCRMAGWTCRCV